MALRKLENRYQVLLIERKHPPYQGSWALPGGFLERDEDAITAAKRELNEETGVKCGRLVEFGSFSDPKRDPRGRTVTISFYTLIRTNASDAQGADDASQAKWFWLRRLPRLAFDHKQMIRQGWKRFQKDSSER